MRARIREQQCAGLRWLVATGDRDEVFHAVGQAARADIHAVQQTLPEQESLRRWSATPDGRQRLDLLERSTARQHPRELSELRALADGSGTDLRHLLLANLRGDLGSGDGTGCTDLAWRRRLGYVAHNEDGAPALAGRLTLLTLRITGETPVTVQWYPGFLPANTFTVTGHGLVWGINHVQATRPADAPGRHFVARGMQQARTLEEAVAYLREHPSAGGFTYTIGECGTGRVAVVEAVAGRVATVQPDGDQPLHWHTNHLRHLPPLDLPDPAASATSNGPAEADEAGRSLGQYEESTARGAVLDQLGAPDEEPEAEWFTEVLTSAPLPHGVHRTAAGSDPLMTLCTSVAELTTGQVTFRGHDGSTTRLALSACARGEPANA